MRWLLLGLALALAGVGHDHPALIAPPDGGPRPVAWWVADRGADRLLGLDRELLVRRVVELRAPLRVLPAPDGLWVVNAADGRPRGPHGLRLLAADGEILAQWELPPVRDAALLPGALALLLADGETAELRCVGAGGATWANETWPGAVALAAAGGRLLVVVEDGPRAGRAWLRGPAGSVGELGLEGRPIDAAAGAGGGWWVLLADGRALRLGPDLERRGALASGLDAPRLAARGPGGALWLVDAERGRARRLEPPEGRRVWAGDLPVAGLEGGWGTPDGGLLAVSAGVLLRLDAAGRTVLGQGGLGFAVDLCPAPLSARRRAAAPARR